MDQHSIALRAANPTFEEGQVCARYLDQAAEGFFHLWLGPRAEPRPLPVRLLPFAAPMLVVLATINRARWIAFGGLAAAAVTALIGVVDLGYVASLGVIEIAIGAAGAAVSVASLAGTYRAAGATGD